MKREEILQKYAKTQYGVQIVWSDPVEAGACKPGEVYVPRWMHFDDPEHAEQFARAYKSTTREKLSWMTDAEFERRGLEHDEIWLAPGVKEVNRATRIAIEVYGEWNIADG